jgi:glycosyltransferase involved in cell wall biosynthesis
MISIITIVFNNIIGIKKTLVSISNIKDKNFEFIIIDGGSNDGTQEIILKYNDIVSHFITEKDKGIYDAMNKGMQRAKGEYILFLNAGDTFASATTLKNLLHDSRLENRRLTGCILQLYPPEQIFCHNYCG